MRQPERITDAAKGRWPGILSALGLPSSFLTGRHGPCPFCQGRDRFRFSDRDGDGRWFCNQCAPGGEDGMALVQRLRGVDFAQAARIVRQRVGSAPLAERKPKDDAATRKNLNGLWRASSMVLPGDPVSRWLSSRVGPVTIPATIRICAKARYWDEDERAETYHPAMVAMIHDAAGKAALLHKTYLTRDGRKAPVKKVRMLMPGTFPAGGAVRLSPAAEVMGIAEGIETAFAASILFGMPVWAALNAGSLEKWTPPAEANRIVIFGDNDENFTGQRAAFSLANRLSREGIETMVRIPDQPGSDWNDVLSQKHRSAA